MANLGTQFECNPIGALDEAQATIARLTAERDQARAEAAAAYERAAREIETTAAFIFTLSDAATIVRRLARLDPDATTALAEIVKRAVDAETRACAEVVGKAWGLSVTALHKQILSRLDRRKEAGE